MGKKFISMSKFGGGGGGGGGASLPKMSFNYILPSFFLLHNDTIILFAVPIGFLCVR